MIEQMREIASQRLANVRSGHLLRGAVGAMFVVIAVVIVLVTRQTMREQALLEAESKARILLDRNLATHTYFSHQLKPHLFEWSEPFRDDEYFDPVWMSSTYAIREIDEYFQSLNPADTYYKECAINARSPENEADDYERQFIEALNRDPDLTKRSLVRRLDGQPYFVTLRRGEVMEESCLRCHSTPEAAPAGLVAEYGPERSFGREVGDVVSAISIRVPLAEAYGEADQFTERLTVVLLAILIGFFAVQVGLSQALLFAPVERLRKQALRIAGSGEHLGAQIPLPPGKELRELTRAFNQMSRALRRSHDDLEQRVEERTADLKTTNERLAQEIVEREQMEKTLEWEAEANTVIANLLHSLLGSTSIDEISDLVLRGAMHLTDSAFGYVGVIDPESGHLVCPTMTREIWDVCEVEDKSIVFEHFGGLWGWVLENQESLLTNEPAEDPRSSGAPEGHVPIQRFLSAPALIGDELVGQVALANADRDYAERDLQLVERLADTYALAVQRLRAEERLEAYAENLEEMVEERTQELREAQEKLLRNEKLTMLGQLAGSINHELRGPLGNIKSGAYFLDMSLEEPDEDVDETVELLQQEVDRAESIVSSLLNFVRTREPQREPVDIDRLIRKLLPSIEIPEGIEVHRDADEDLPMILADPDQLRQVFRNLTTNAVEAMPEGGHLTIQISKPPEGSVGSERQILVAVSDTGEGIPEENQERVFEPLFSTKSEGVGLGLALTRMLVEAHEGTIAVESEEGQGSTFTVRLPLRHEEDNNGRGTRIRQ